jgi:L-serine dehydratase
MRAARRFLIELTRTDGDDSQVPLTAIGRVRVHLYGSLGATGVGHGTITAVVLGLVGAEPHSIDPDSIAPLIAHIQSTRSLRLLDQVAVPFELEADVLMHAATPPERNDVRSVHTQWCAAASVQLLLSRRRFRGR